MKTNRFLSYFSAVMMMFMTTNLSAQFSGDYIIDSEGEVGVNCDYLSVYDAVADLDGKTIDGETTFLIRDGVYADDRIYFNNVNGTESNPVIFIPHPDNTGNIEIYGVDFTNTSYVTIKDLYFLSATSGQTVAIKSNTNHLTLSDNTINHSTGELQTIIINYPVDTNIHNIEIIGNIIDNDNAIGPVIEFTGDASSEVTMADGIIIEGNTFTNVLKNAVSLYGCKNFAFNDNLIDYTSDGSAVTVVEFNNCGGDSKISGNQIHIDSEIDSDQSIYALKIDDYIGSFDDKLLIYNNMLSVVNTGSINTNTAGYGIFISNSDYISMYYNSVYVKSIHLGSALQIEASASVNSIVKNNVFVKDDSEGYIVYYDLTGIESNYNLLQAESTFTGYYNTDVYDMSTWTGLTSGSASIEGIANFSDPLNGDLSISDFVSFSGADLGLPVPGIYNDIDGDIRSQAVTDLGADEEYDSSLTYAGEDQEICDDHTWLQADDEETGVWSILSGSGTISDPNLSRTEVTNLGAGSNVFKWTVDGSGATDNVTITNNGFTIAAGSDQLLCVDNSTLMAEAPGAGYSGYWTITAGSVDFVDITAYNSEINNIAKGENILEWTVERNDCVASDEISITNDSPDAAQIDPLPNSGEICENFVSLSAQPVGVGNGTWSIYSGSGTLSSLTDENIDFTNIAQGTSILKWTVEHNSCSLEDEIIITNNEVIADAGADQSFTVAYPEAIIRSTVLEGLDPASVYPYQGTGTWTKISGEGIIENSLLYNTNVSGLSHGDNQFEWTVSLGNCTASDFVNIATGYEIVEPVDDATDFNWDDPLSWSTGTVPTSADSVTIANSITHINGIDAYVGALTIGSGGLLDIVGSARAPLAGIHAHSLYIEQTAERGEYRGVAEVRITSGGSLYIEQSAERAATSPGVYVRNGGSLYIEQSAERATEPSRLNIAYGGNLYIEQSAERAGTPGRVTIMGGGSLYIEQSAERADNRNVTFDTHIRNGGSLYIEQSAERALPATMSVYGIENIGGQIVIGADATTSVPVATLSCKKLLTEQGSTPLDGLISEANVIIKATGGLTLESATTEGENWMKFAEGTTFTIENGGTLDFSSRANRVSADFIIEDGASVIDMNETNALTAQTKIDFIAGEKRYYTSSLANPQTDAMPNVTDMRWDEINGLWEANPDNTLSLARGYQLTNSASETVSPAGVLNAGEQIIPITADNSTNVYLQGWNFIGNPYASSIDWEILTFEDGCSNTYYVYNSENQNYEAYQQGGLNVNGGTQYIDASQAFFIKNESAASFIFENAARVHYFPTVTKAPIPNTRVLDNFIRFKADNGAGLIDETVIYLSDTTSNDLLVDEDAVKPFEISSHPVALYTEAGFDELPLTINALENTAGLVSIPLNFRADAAGSYTITASELYFGSDITVELEDTQLGTTQDLKSNPVINITYATTDAPERFNLKITSPAVNNENTLSNAIKIYTSGKDIFITSLTDGRPNVQVYDIAGKLVKETFIEAPGMNRINTHLNSGVYVVKIITNSGILTEKVVLR